MRPGWPDAPAPDEPGGTTPMRTSIVCGLVLGHRVLERDVPGCEPHLLVTALVVEAGLVPGVGLVQAAAEVGHGRPPDVLGEARLESAGSTECRIIDPNPSTVPMRVSVVMTGSGTPLAINHAAWATLG